MQVQQHRIIEAEEATMWKSDGNRRTNRRRIGSTEVVYRTASGGTLIAAAPSGQRQVRLFRPTVARRGATP
jgi:hypothetical protein